MLGSCRDSTKKCQEYTHESKHHVAGFFHRVVTINRIAKPFIQCLLTLTRFDGVDNTVSQSELISHYVLHYFLLGFAIPM